MPQSLHCKYGHIVFSTKDRQKLITEDVEKRLYEYLGGIIKSLNGNLLQINGMPDHLHLLIRESKTSVDQEFIGQLKGDSSRWVNKTFSGRPHFSWQKGYGWFSVGPQDLDVAIKYIKTQKEHHQSLTFQEEYQRFLKKYKVQFDEQYLWD